MTTPRISFYRGDSHTVDVDATASGQPLDVTGAAALLSVKVSDGATDYALQKAGAIVNGPGGALRFTIAPADTATLAAGLYAFDVQITLAGGEVYTLAKGTLELLQDVTI